MPIGVVLEKIFWILKTFDTDLEIKIDFTFAFKVDTWSSNICRYKLVRIGGIWKIFDEGLL